LPLLFYDEIIAAKLKVVEAMTRYIIKIPKKKFSDMEAGDKIAYLLT